MESWTSWKDLWGLWLNRSSEQKIDDSLTTKNCLKSAGENEVYNVDDNVRSVLAVRLIVIQIFPMCQNGMCSPSSWNSIHTAPRCI